MSVGMQFCRHWPSEKQSGSLEQIAAWGQQLCVTQASHVGEAKMSWPQWVPASVSWHGIAQFVCKQETKLLYVGCPTVCKFWHPVMHGWSVGVQRLRQLVNAKHSAVLEQVMAGVQHVCSRHASQVGSEKERFPHIVPVAPSTAASPPVPPVGTLPFGPDGPAPQELADPWQSVKPAGWGEL